MTIIKVVQLAIIEVQVTNNIIVHPFAKVFFIVDETPY
jgi:hypothetical protein